MAVYTGTASVITAGQTAGVSTALATYSGSLNAFGAMTAYASTWGATAAPAIGNGNVTAAYTQIQKTVFFRISVNFGTTTTFGTGAYTLTLPVAPNASVGRLQFAGWLYQGSALYNIAGHVQNSTTTMQLYYVNSTTGTAQVAALTGAAPVTLTAAVGNSINISGFYEAA